MACDHHRLTSHSLISRRDSLPSGRLALPSSSSAAAAAAAIDSIAASATAPSIISEDAPPDFEVATADRPFSLFLPYAKAAAAAAAAARHPTSSPPPPPSTDATDAVWEHSEESRADDGEAEEPVPVDGEDFEEATPLVPEGPERLPVAEAMVLEAEA